MKILLLLAMILHLMVVSLNAQDTLAFIADTTKVYSVKIKQYEEPLILKGAIYQLKDSSLLFSNSINIIQGYTRVTDISELYINDIRSINYSNNGMNVILGALIGSAVSFGLGFAIGYIANPSGNECWFCDPVLDGLGLGLIVILPGGILGGYLGSKRTHINGSLDNYKSYKDRLSKYAIY